MNRQNLINTAVLKDKLQVYAMNVGRISVRPVLLLYFIMVSKDTPGENGAFPPTRNGCIHSLSMRERG